MRLPWGQRSHHPGKTVRLEQERGRSVCLFLSASLYQPLGKSYREMWAFTLWLLYEPASHHHQSDVSVFIFLYSPKPPSKLPAVSHLWETTSNVTLISPSPPTADNNSLPGTQQSLISLSTCRLASWLPSFRDRGSLPIASVLCPAPYQAPTRQILVFVLASCQDPSA